MNTQKKKKKQSSKGVWIITGAVLTILLGGCVFLISLLSEDLGPRRKTQTATVNLIKPPPPPVPKEKPPEPEPEARKKALKQEIIDTEIDKARPDDAKPDEKPPGKQLGLDAEGAAGSDSFGLVGNKGGAGLIGGGGGGGGNPLFRKFGWYTSIIQDELARKVRKRLEESGSMPKDKGKLETSVHISLNAEGKIVEYKVLSPTGDRNLDKVVEEILKLTTISRPPPQGMPKEMTIRIAAKS